MPGMSVFVAGLADRVTPDPVGELRGEIGAPLRRQPPGIGQAVRRRRESGFRHDGADHNGSCPGAAAHLVYARCPRAADGRELALDLVTGPRGPRPLRRRHRTESQLLRDAL
jgi:hypothetical protein